MRVWSSASRDVIAYLFQIVILFHLPRIYRKNVISARMLQSTAVASQTSFSPAFRVMANR